MSSRQEHKAEEPAERQITLKALAQLGEIDVEHHHHEQEQHRDRADIDDDQNHREEFGAQQHEQRRGVEEGENQKQHRVHGIARGDDHQGRADHDGGKHIKGNRLEHGGR